METTVLSEKTLGNGDKEVNLKTVVVKSGPGEAASGGGEPQIKGRNVRQLLRESARQSGGSEAGALQSGAFRNTMRRLFGIEARRDPRTGASRLVLNESKAQIGFDEFSIRDLSYEFLGQQTVEGMHNLKLAESTSMDLREALAPVGSSTFQDINAFNQTIGGLIEVRLLKGYQLPEFIAERVMEHMPTKVNGGKLIGIPNIQLPDGPTIEGQEYPSVGMQERWAIAQANVKYAQKLALTREASVYDLTGELGAAAEGMGMTLGYLKEYWSAAVVQGRDIPAGTPGFQVGRTANTYIYNGQATDTPNATYQTAAGTGTSLKYNFINSLSNVLTNYASFQTVQQKLNLMREFETNYPILTNFKEILVSPNNIYNARNIVHASQVIPASGVLSGQSNFPAVLTTAPNPVPDLTIHASNIWNKQLVDSGLTQTNADIYWYGGDFKKSFVWREVWPMSVIQANPLSPELLGADIINAWYASWYGVPCVRDPHYSVQSTN